MPFGSPKRTVIGSIASLDDLGRIISRMMAKIVRGRALEMAEAMPRQSGRIDALGGRPGDVTPNLTV